MLSVAEAAARILEGGVKCAIEPVPLDAALDRVLATDIRAPGDLPPWDASAMDGYALRTEDLAAGCTRFRVVDDIAAGRVGSVPVGVGQAARIMTGAPVPAGADCVVMVEDTSTDGADMTLRQREGPGAHGGCGGSPPGLPAPGRHVRRRGSEIAAGSLVLTAGTPLGPGALALLAGLGLWTVPVYRAPRVAIVSTGDELVQPGSPLGSGQIHASNACLLAAWVRRAGGIPVDLGVFPDRADAITRAFEAASAYDVVLSSGGVSVGDHDYVKPALARAGVTLEFWRVAMKPGKPVAFGRYPSGTPVFGLPGNPASCMVNVALFVWPLLRAMQGDAHPQLPRLEAEFEAPVRRSPGRPEYVRVALSRRADGTLMARPAGPQGSASLLSLSGADGLAVLPAEGDVVDGRVPVIVVDPAWERAAWGARA